METKEKKMEKIQIVKIDQLDVKNLEEFKGAETQQLELLKENPFVEIEDNKSYELAKKNRTALVKGRTSIEKQDKLIASKIKTLRDHVMEQRDYLINITKEAEEKQQNEVKIWEAAKEEERLEKIRKEEERLDSLKNELESEFKEIISHVNQMDKLTESELIESKINAFKEEGKTKYEEDFLLLFEDRYDSALLALSNRKKDIEKELEYEKQQAELKAEQEKLRKEREERIKEEDVRQTELAAKEEKIRKEQEAIDKKKREQEEAEKAQSVFVSRTKRLNEELGLKFNFVDAFVHPKDEGLSITVDNIKSMDEDSFDEFVIGAIEYQKPVNTDEEVEEEVEVKKEEPKAQENNHQKIIEQHKEKISQIIDEFVDHKINPLSENVEALSVFTNKLVVICKEFTSKEVIN